MDKPKRIPAEGERIRIKLVSGRWVWADVDYVELFDDEPTIIYVAQGRLGTVRLVNEYGMTWRFGEDDPEVCAERPAAKGDE